MTLIEAENIMGDNFIGPAKLNKISHFFNIKNIPDTSIPEIPFSEKILRENRKEYILILGVPFNKKGKKLTIDNLRLFFSCDPKIKKPCFYNQDWYLEENFAKNQTLKFKWYLIRKVPLEKSRGKKIEEITSEFNRKESFPTAILAAFTFFAYYLLTGKILWKHDFIWCSDTDKNGDRIYVGRYEDPLGINKNGFNVHRHLSINSFYGVAPEIKI